MLAIIGVTVVMGLGMANVLAPCTDSIMGSLPRAKAGVGSAVNDTTRQMGGAVGVAVFGSLMASHFHSTITDKLGSVLPAGLFAQVKDNVGQAVGVATQSPAARPFSGQIINAANDTFVSGLHLDRARGRGHHAPRRARRLALPAGPRPRRASRSPRSSPEPEPVGGRLMAIREEDVQAARRSPA